MMKLSQVYNTIGTVDNKALDGLSYATEISQVHIQFNNSVCKS